METNIVITDKKNSKEGDNVLIDLTAYQRLIGKLIYLTLTRQDISYTVHCLSQFMHCPLDSHVKLAFRVLRYIKGSPGKGIVFSKGDNLNLTAYVDSDWAKCLSTRKSITGFAVYLGNCLVAWKSKKQSTVSRSTAEAEYRALAAAVCEVIWIKKVLIEFNVVNNLPAKIFCDNKAAILISANPVFHERTKHFEIDLHFVREKIGLGVTKVEKINTAENTADIFTKSLSTKSHKFFCDRLNLLDLFQG